MVELYFVCMLLVSHLRALNSLSPRIILLPLPLWCLLLAKRYYIFIFRKYYELQI